MVKKRRVFFSLQKLSTFYNPHKKRKNKEGRKGASSGSTQNRLLRGFFLSQMGALQAMVVCLFLVRACTTNAQVEQWKSATATYSKETDASIITGTSSASSYLPPLSLHFSNSTGVKSFQEFLSVYYCRRCLWLWGPSQDQLWKVQCWTQYHVVQ